MLITTSANNPAEKHIVLHPILQHPVCSEALVHFWETWLLKKKWRLQDVLTIRWHVSHQPWISLNSEVEPHTSSECKVETLNMLVKLPPFYFSTRGGNTLSPPFGWKVAFFFFFLSFFFKLGCWSVCKKHCLKSVQSEGEDEVSSKSSCVSALNLRKLTVIFRDTFAAEGNGPLWQWLWDICC